MRFGVVGAATFLHNEHVVDPADFEPGLTDEQQPRKHLLDLGIAALTLDFAFAPTPWLALEARVPLRAVQAFARFIDAEGKPLDVESIHHRTELIAGPADPELAARLQANELLLRGLSGALRLGFTIPVGNTEPDPFELAKRGVAHQHVFFGTGTVDPVVGAQLAYDLEVVRLGGFADVRAPLYYNADGYVGPTTATLGAFVDGSYGLDGWTFRVAPELFLESPARWRSGGGAEGELTGRVDALLGAGAFWQVSESIELESALKITVVNWGPAGFYQLYAPVLLVVGARWDVPLP